LNEAALTLVLIALAATLVLLHQHLQQYLQPKYRSSNHLKQQRV